MTHPVRGWLASVVIAAALAGPAMAGDITVKMLKLTQDGTSDPVGTVTISETDDGTTFTLDLFGLAPGQHGFHVHENPSCSPTLLNGIRIPGGAAGGHFDPERTGKHLGPAGDGHLGDLPELDADASGKSTQVLTAPRIRDMDMLKGRSLLIQAGGDNYSDSPALMGGGGARFACGIIE